MKTFNLELLFYLFPRKAVFFTNMFVGAFYILFVVVLYTGVEFMEKIFDDAINLIGTE